MVKVLQSQVLQVSLSFETRYAEGVQNATRIASCPATERVVSMDISCAKLHSDHLGVLPVLEPDTRISLSSGTD
jgi:hypothetical protein